MTDTPAPAEQPAGPTTPARLVAMKEPRRGEHRVAITPDTVKTYVAAGLDVVVESGAGVDALISDEDYAAAGATIGGPDAAGAADILIHVRPLLPEQIAALKPGALTVGLTTGRHQLEGVRALADKGCTTLAMELIPRISRAQSMDALTSQALISGYRTVLHAAMRMPKFFPMFMTAAGTIPPAKVLVLGVGVAGLQAIATAKRLGAIVKANDIRSSSAEEVRSMGGTFIDLEMEAADAAGGYAKQLSTDSASRQRQLLAPHVAEADVLITTALIQGKDAPVLVTTDMLMQMKPGSVAIDMAADKGGNIEGAEPGVDKMVGNVRLYGMFNPPSSMPVDASRLYAKNIANLLALVVKDGAVNLDLDDEVIAGCCLMTDGVVRHEPTLARMQAELPGSGPADSAGTLDPTANPPAAGIPPVMGSATETNQED